MKLYVKNMVCPRCIMAVKNVLREQSVDYQDVRLGEVITSGELTKEQLKDFRMKLKSLGFELLDDMQTKTIEQIKAVVIENVHHIQQTKMNLSDTLTLKLHRDYSWLSKLFSSTEGMTIEHYVMLQKAERIKELLSYGEKNLSEIAVDMGYSSVAHLSSQFKKITGMTPTRFKAQGISLRRSLDDLKG